MSPTTQAPTTNEEKDLPDDNYINPPDAGDEFDFGRVKVINFGKNPNDYSSADGSLALSQINVPELEIKFPSGTSGAHTVHVIAEVLTLNTYNTSSKLQINFKSISE